MIDEYLQNRQHLTAIIQLVDMRHRPSNDDITMIEYTRSIGYKPIIIATKLDKLRASEIEPNLDLIAKTLKIPIESIIP